MDKIRIIGGKPLKGTIPISGAKNAALPLMAASLLTEQPLTLQGVPDLADIRTMQKLLEQHGVEFNAQSGAMRMQGAHITSLVAPYELVRTMRASVLVLGPLLARFGEAKVSLPGGCAIGTRPIDLHLKALEHMGAEITLEEGYVHAKGTLKGAEIHFDKVSVGATENLLMAASLASGTTRIHNAAREPEVTDLAHCLAGMGAKIEGIGTDTLTIQGVTSLRAHTHRVIPDRIETGTYMVAAAITRGDILLKGGRADLLTSLSEKLEEVGVHVQETPEGLRVTANGRTLQAADLTTQVYPGFPTDMQAQMMSLLCLAEGASMISETIFENRFMHVPELARMGADIHVNGHTALVRGVSLLTGASVMATDLRASVSLVLAGLAAQGETVIHRVYHLDRGYEHLEEKLGSCGATIERIA